MTHEQKELLLKDLCGRLPYGVKVQLTEYSDLTGEKLPNKIKILDYCMLGRVQAYCKGFRKDEIKPYLFPLSSMTDEQKQELNKLSEKECYIIEDAVNNPNPSNVGFPVVTHYMVDWCNKNHFDYRGLIPMGLANDATGLNIY